MIYNLKYSMFFHVYFLLKKRNKIYLISIVYVSFFISIYLYILSLKGCFESFERCASMKRYKEYFHLGVLLILSCAIFSALILISIISRLSLINYALFFVTFFAIFSFLLFIYIIFSIIFDDFFNFLMKLFLLTASNKIIIIFGKNFFFN